MPRNSHGLRFPACAATLAGNAKIPAPIIELMTTNAMPGAPIARISDGFTMVLSSISNDYMRIHWVAVRETDIILVVRVVARGRHTDINGNFIVR